MLAILSLQLFTASVATAQSPASAAQVADLRRQLDALRRKTDSLQKRSDSLVKALGDFIARHEAQHDADDKNDQIKEAQDKREADALEKRLDAIEARLASLVRGAPPSKSTNAAASTVRAPFVVEDQNGDIIMRVTGGKSPRLMIGEDKGGSVELGTGSAGGGVVRVRDASNTDGVILIASDGAGQLRALSRTRSAVITANDGETGATLSLFVGDTPTARIQSGLLGFGALFLADPGGTPMVFAGTLGDQGVGTVRTGPKARAGTLGPPSILQGAR